MPLRDADIRPALARFAALACPGGTVLEEVGLLHGACRVDVAALSPRCLHGWEIKGDTDTLKRLPSQVDAYSRVLDRCTLVTGEALAAPGAAAVPEWWGLMRAHQTPRGVRLEVVREGAPNPFAGHDSAAWLLWRAEAEALLVELGLARGVRGKSRQTLYRRLTDSLPAAELRAHVRRLVCARGDWRTTVDVNP